MKKYFLIGSGLGCAALAASFIFQPRVANKPAIAQVAQTTQAVQVEKPQPMGSLKIPAGQYVRLFDENGKALVLISSAAKVIEKGEVKAIAGGEYISVTVEDGGIRQSGYLAKILL